MKKLLYRAYPALINVYTVWLLYLLFFASFRYSETTLFEIENIPFETITKYFVTVLPYRPFEFVENVFGNIILFVPYGFLGILYTKLKNIFLLLLIFFIVINIIEFSQFYFKRGFADIDDIILNTLGVIIGYFIYRKFFFIKDR